MTSTLPAVIEPRKDYYGAGRQPWDDIKDAGWAPEFCAGNILKYLRRTKSPEHSLESARWYWKRLQELDSGNPEISTKVRTLIGLLTDSEIAKLREE